MLELKGNIVNLEDVPKDYFDVRFNMLDLIKFKDSKYSEYDVNLFGAYGSTERGTFISELIQSYYWMDAKVNQNTFKNNFSRIWNRNITQFIHGLIKNDLVNDIELDLVERTTSSETGESLNEIIKDKNLSSTETGKRDETGLSNQKENDNTIDDVVRDKNITDNESSSRDEVGNVLGKSKRADNPNTTTENLLNDYITQAEEIENDNTLNITNEGNKESNETENLNTTSTSNKNIESDNTLNVINESNRSSEENETSNVVGSDSKHFESEVKGNSFDNFLKLADNNAFSGLINDFLSKFSTLLLPIFNE